MDEKLKLNWGKSFIEIDGGSMSVKHKGNAIMNGTLGGKSDGSVITGRIEDFNLQHFKVLMGRNVNIILEHKPTGTKYRIEIMVKKREVADYELFRDIMDRHGAFSNQSRTDVFYGKDSNFQKDLQETKEKFAALRAERQGQKEDDQEFLQKLQKLPGFSLFGTTKEIKYLKNVLYDGEEVYAATSGVMDGNTWLITCTSKRVIFIDCGMVYGVKHSETMINRINGISFKKGLVMGEIYIESAMGSKVIKNVPKESTKPFVDAVHRSISEYSANVQSTQTTVIQQTAPEVGVADELLKLKQLLDMGVISEEDFQRQKEKLLG